MLQRNKQPSGLRSTLKQRNMEPINLNALSRRLTSTHKLLRVLDKPATPPDGGIPGTVHRAPAARRLRRY
jgi:hypothetical protein